MLDLNSLKIRLGMSDWCV